MRTPLEIETHAALNAIRGAQEDFAKLDELLPKSKRGSRVQTVLDSLKMRLDGAHLALGDALRAGQ